MGETQVAFDPSAPYQSGQSAAFDPTAPYEASRQGEPLTPGESLSTGAGIGIPGVIQGGPQLAGAVKGAGETAHTIGRLINAATGDKISWLPTSMEQPKELESSNMAESAGKMGEAVAEFALGDEALKGMSVMERLGVAQKISKLAEESPILAKLVQGGLALMRGSAAGGVTGGLHGGAQGAAEGAAAGAGGEVLGAGVGQVGKIVQIPSKAEAGNLLGDVVKAIGNHPVVADEPAEIADQLLSQKANFGSKLPGIKDTLNRLLERSTDPNKPLTFAEGREFEKIINSIPKSTIAKMDGTVKHLFTQLQTTLRSAMQETADLGGMGEQYRQGMRGFRQASLYEKAAEHLKEHGVKYGLGAAAGAAGSAAFGAYKATQ